MAKVVYNGCYGGFGLSETAKTRMIELGYVKPPDEYEWYHIPRHHKILVHVVEELKKDANGIGADLRIAFVDKQYFIDDYDGREAVITPELTFNYPYSFRRYKDTELITITDPETMDTFEFFEWLNTATISQLENFSTL